MSVLEVGTSDDRDIGPLDASSPDEASDAEGGGFGLADAGGSRLVAYTGGYASTISWLAVDGATGALSPSGSIASFGSSPSFLAHNAAMTNLYAVDENSNGRVGAYAVDADSGALSKLTPSRRGRQRAGVSLARRQRASDVLVANYNDGTVAVLPIGTGGRLGARLILTMQAPWAPRRT